MRFGVLTTVKTADAAVFWVITLCGLIQWLNTFRSNIMQVSTDELTSNHSPEGYNLDRTGSESCAVGWLSNW